MNSPVSQSAPDYGDQLLQFESQWYKGSVPDVACYFSDHDDRDRQFIEDLIEIDLECRWKQFQPDCDLAAKDPHGFPLFPRIDDYAALLPQSLRQSLFSPRCVAEEYRARSRWGDRPDKESFLDRFPGDPAQIEAALLEIERDFENEGIGVSEESSRPVAASAEPTVILGQPPQTESTSTPVTELTGTQIGKYQLESRLGQGAFGEVWKARDPELNRCVAIKIPRQDKHFSDELLATFRTEARKLAALDHIPGIVDVFDSGEHNGQPYFVSRFIVGESLADRMERQVLSHDESAELIAKVADSLKRAHKLKLVHRDIKPANILLDEENQPFLADFGMAATDEELLAEGRSVMGTYAYMAPEQARGDSHRVDGRADIYALGVVLYRLLTQELPYSGRTTEQYLQNIQQQKPRPPRQIDENIPVELERICLKCLKKDEDQRYSSAGDLAADLRAIRQHAIEPLSIPASPGRMTDQPRSVRSRMLLVSLLTPVVLLAAAIAWKSNGFGLAGKKPASTTAESEPLENPRLPRKWYNLMETTPRVVYFPKHEPASDWHFNPDEEYLAVNSQKNALFLSDSTNSPSYRVQLSISRNGLERGASGLILGYQEKQGDDPEVEATFQTVYLKCVDGKDFSIQRAVMKLTQHEGEHPAFDSYSFSSQPIEPLDFKEGILDVRVRAGKISEIRWNGKPLNSLTAGDPPQWLPVALNTSGQIGVINAYEDAKFRDFRLMIETY